MSKEAGRDINSRIRDIERKFERVERSIERGRVGKEEEIKSTWTIIPEPGDRDIMKATNV